MGKPRSAAKSMVAFLLDSGLDIEEGRRRRVPIGAKPICLRPRKAAT
jgi:hypothetical protein